MLILLFKVNTNAGTAGTGDRGLKLLYFFKLTQIGFHFFDQHIHLLQGTTIRKRCIGRQHHLFITCEIAAFVYLFNKKAKAASKSFSDFRFFFFLKKWKGKIGWLRLTTKYKLPHANDTIFVSAMYRSA